MKQGLHLQLGQQLKMTPQLQQAIRLLQLSALDLRQEIQDTVESNPPLELEDDAGDFAAEAIPESSSEGDREELDLDNSDHFADDLQVDTDWDDIYPGSSTGSGSGSGLDEEGD